VVAVVGIDADMIDWFKVVGTLIAFAAVVIAYGEFRAKKTDCAITDKIKVAILESTHEIQISMAAIAERVARLEGGKRLWHGQSLQMAAVTV
jgi:hypothetical protein